MAATFRVTSSHIVRTAAERRLPSTDSVLTMLKWVERHLNQRGDNKPKEDFEDDPPVMIRRPSKSRSKKDGVKVEMSYMPKPNSEPAN